MGALGPLLAAASGEALVVQLLKVLALLGLDPCMLEPHPGHRTILSAVDIALLEWAP